jgi:hypothetical protein
MRRQRADPEGVEGNSRGCNPRGGNSTPESDPEGVELQEAGSASD